MGCSQSLKLGVEVQGNNVDTVHIGLNVTFSLLQWSIQNSIQTLEKNQSISNTTVHRKMYMSNELLFIISILKH